MADAKFRVVGAGPGSEAMPGGNNGAHARPFKVVINC